MTCFYFETVYHQENIEQNHDLTTLQSLNNTEERYRELQTKMGSVDGGLEGINQKAKDMKKEAEDLLNEAKKGIEQLKSEYTKPMLTVDNANVLHFTAAQLLSSC